MNYWTQCLDDKCPVDVVYLDFQKAFDSVPHKYLLSKLYGYGIQGNLLSWIEAFLIGRKQKVVIVLPGLMCLVVCLKGLFWGPCFSTYM